MKPWPLILACVVLTGALGFLYSLSHGEVTPAKKSFSEFPVRLSDRWEGEELGLEEDVLEVLQLSDYMMRLYTPIRQADAPASVPLMAPLALYVGFYQSQRTGATYHSPKNCLPGAGWNFVDTQIVSVPLKEGQEISINKVLIQKGLDKQLILYWYHDRGRVIASEYWAKAYMVWDAMAMNRTDGALVRISVPVQTDADQAFQAGLDFLQDMWPALLEHMPDQQLTKA